MYPCRVYIFPLSTYAWSCGTRAKFLRTFFCFCFLLIAISLFQILLNKNATFKLRESEERYLSGFSQSSPPPPFDVKKNNEEKNSRYSCLTIDRKQRHRNFSQATAEIVSLNYLRFDLSVATRSENGVRFNRSNKSDGWRWKINLIFSTEGSAILQRKTSTFVSHSSHTFVPELQIPVLNSFLDYFEI